MQCKTDDHRLGIGLALMLVGYAALSCPSVAAKERGTKNEASLSVFQLPRYSAVQQQLTRLVAKLVRAGRLADAENAVRAIIKKHPRWPFHHYSLAVILARQNKQNEAIDSIIEAIKRGFRNVAALEREPSFNSLRNIYRFRVLVENLRPSQGPRDKKRKSAFSPNTITNGRALVGPSNTTWVPRSNILISAFRFDTEAPGQTVYGGEARFSRILNLWYRQGKAAGNHGDLYDNRDKGHSLLRKDVLPQVTHVVYGPEAQAAKTHNGVNSQFLFNAPTFGNSSTAVTAGPLWRSLPRLIMTTPGLVKRAYQQYINDHLYVFPEHRDHDSEHGDLFPANTPYMLVSQGSSRSDKPILRAIGAILAAFRPDTKAFLRKHHLMMPTVQLIFRSGLKQVEGKADYLSAKAHPSVFNTDDLDVGKMIRHAQRLRPDSIPPVVKISATEPDALVAPSTYFAHANASERLFDTPSAIARVMRATTGQHRMVISAAETKDPNGRALTFEWRVLRGDKAKISIKPLDTNGRRAELNISWHERRPVPGSPSLLTNRVDIAVFASNGHQISSPAFVSFAFPPNQERYFDDEGRLRGIRYDAEHLRNRYVDPALFVLRGWSDRYEYDEKGRLLGWKRVRGADTIRFTRNGERVKNTDAQDRPTKAERVRYVAKKLKSGLSQIIVIPTGEIVSYTYSSDNDPIGKPQYNPPIVEKK